jgi:hypothetical protein
LLDHANKPGKKILMSGGGRCNFTNMYTEPANFLSPQSTLGLTRAKPSGIPPPLQGSRVDTEVYSRRYTSVAI